MNEFRVDVASMIIVADLPDGPCRAKYDATYVVVLYGALWQSWRWYGVHERMRRRRRVGRQLALASPPFCGNGPHPCARGGAFWWLGVDQSSRVTLYVRSTPYSAHSTNQDRSSNLQSHPVNVQVVNLRVHSSSTLY
jgi:hypothetical protein